MDDLAIGFPPPPKIRKRETCLEPIFLLSIRSSPFTFSYYYQLLSLVFGSWAWLPLLVSFWGGKEPREEEFCDMPDPTEPVLTPVRTAAEPDGVARKRQKRLLTIGEPFLKRYRTEIAASASSCVSTFVAVSTFFLRLNPLNSQIWIEREGCGCKWYKAKYAGQFPLDSVKTRMQAWVFSIFYISFLWLYLTCFLFYLNWEPKRHSADGLPISGSSGTNSEASGTA